MTHLNYIWEAPPIYGSECEGPGIRFLGVVFIISQPQVLSDNYKVVPHSFHRLIYLELQQLGLMIDVT